MTLPSSGSLGAGQINVELKRIEGAPFSMDGSAERGLVGVPSGSIAFEDFYGKSSEIVASMVAGSSQITLQSLFSPGDWIGSVDKRVILPAGRERGHSTSDFAVTIGTVGWGGTLTFEVHGTISGRGGAANGGTGGHALNANRLGVLGQRLNLIIGATGVLRGGGGGGGAGGTGGGGVATSTVREPSAGNYLYSAAARWVVTIQPGNNSVQITHTASDTFSAVAGNNTTLSVSTNGRTWYRGELISSSATDYPYTYNYSMYSTYTTSTNTAGGAGGSGGKGQGFDGARAAGTGGSAGGAGAGTGGTGGTGGIYGTSGNTGNTGSNGSRTNGSVGTAGGVSGLGLSGLANVNLSNSGSILGRTA